ncbi:ABC transporter substrate-binding protein [Ramlibacter ginsenosidimutans]|uniref:ABC transporter substrate-binding protein n=1 Tax=Ramlibacter ginsenosidimutans TaxID=502333 RepID=A0A934U0P5_9BURK|nr:ABC transporter substrate-binding protein [Ramlibacter ginsenosidimutans]MBK6009280.1 ABC transporter substrate-binding protein [Ramlibacter ginsenosidimutans]
MHASTLARCGRALALCALFAPALALADIVLGTSGDLSGTSAALTKDYVRGMSALFDEVNRKGGIRGEKIKLVVLDDGFSPDRTAENTKALIEQNALALVGYRGTANVQKIIPMLQASGIAEIGNTSGAKSLRDPYVENLFHLRASTGDEIEAAVNHAWTIGITRIAAAYQDDAFGKESVEALNVALKKRGSAPVALAPVPRGTVDVAKAVETVAAQTPQAVMYFGQSKPAAALVRGIRAKGVQPQFFVLSVASGLHADLGDEAAGVIVSQVVPYPFTELGNPVVREYQKVVGAQDAGKFSYNSMEGFLTAKLVVAALQKTAPPLTRARLITTLKGLNNEDLGGFAISYGPQNNLGSRFVALSMIRKDGSFAH